MKLVLHWFSVSLFEDSQFSTFLTSALAVLFRFCKSLSLIIKTVPSANNRTLNLDTLGRSLTYSEKRVGPKIEP